MLREEEVSYDPMNYIDEMGDNYHLVPQEYHPGEPACVGCAFKFGNSEACKKAKTCTPTEDGTNRTPRVVTGRHVWKRVIPGGDI